jgi:hypothetical protein
MTGTAFRDLIYFSGFVLFVLIISKNITEIVGPSIREWKYFMKNVDEDFKDVEETDFMDDGVRIAIQKMEHFINVHCIFSVFRCS